MLRLVSEHSSWWALGDLGQEAQSQSHSLGPGNQPAPQGGCAYKRKGVGPRVIAQ